MSTNAAPAANQYTFSLSQVIRTWWPLAASWLLMGAEMPVLSAFVARMPSPEINLAAIGGVVFPLSLIIEAPIIMLLAASTALCKDWRSYRLIYRFMMITSAALTALHILLAFTPLYDLVVVNIINIPPEIIEPARASLMIMIPWTWSIAYRRLHQGVLIRYGYSKAVGMGTAVRLLANIIVLSAGYALANIPGNIVGACAVAAGVVSEAAYIGLAVRPVLKDDLRCAPMLEPALTFREFIYFYIPLAMTSLLSLLANPIGSAALSRMPQALNSLAVWPVVTGLVFMLRGLGIAYNEVVVTLLDREKSTKVLLRFAMLLAGATTAGLFLVAGTPFSSFWFEKFSALSPELYILARRSIWLALPLPALSVLQSWYQGMILYGKRTRGITESVAVYLLTSAIVLGIGVNLFEITGLYIGIISLTLSTATQTAWLWLRSRPLLVSLKLRDG